MPFIRDETNIQWPDDGSDPPPPKPSDFQYLAPPEFGGARSPVSFTVPTPIDPETAPPTTRQRLLQMFGIKPDANQNWQREHTLGTRNLMALTVPALKALGIQAVYCRYDGGNDEGFSWLDHARMRDGSTMDVEALIGALAATDLPGALLAARVLPSDAKQPIDRQLADTLQYWLTNEWAALLLSPSYGTGEYSMYGAFTVDLDALTITDDPDATPVVENIAIDLGER